MRQTSGEGEDGEVGEQRKEAGEERTPAGGWRKGGVHSISRGMNI